MAGPEFRIYYINHVLLVVLRLMGTFENVFRILTVHILCGGRTLDLTKDIIYQMVESNFHVKVESCRFAKKSNHCQICSSRAPHHFKIVNN